MLPRKPPDQLLLRLNPRVLSDPPGVIRVHRLDDEERHRLEAAGIEVARGVASVPATAEGLPEGIDLAVGQTLRSFAAHEFTLKSGGRSLTLGQETRIMGVLNVTPDSFSDGGRFPDPKAAVTTGLRMSEQGASIVDVGGESTRPGSEPVSEEEEQRRVLPVVEGLAERGVLVSIDTSKPSVARAALKAGAFMVNDVTALRSPDMAEVVATAGVPVVLMHMKGTPRSMQQNPAYDDIIEEITRFLRQRAAEALRAGLDRSSILLDPGIGFGKRLEHNLEILRRLREFRSLGFPLLVGPSRKRFIGAVLAERPVHLRLHGTLGAVAACVMNGVQIVRVHDVAETRDAVRVLDAVKRNEPK